MMHLRLYVYWGIHHTTLNRTQHEQNPLIYNKVKQGSMFCYAVDVNLFSYQSSTNRARIYYRIVPLKDLYDKK